MADLGRFAVCGLGAATADLGTYVLLGAAGIHPLAAHLVSRPLGGVVSFLGNRFWTFRSQHPAAGWTVQVRRYATIWLGAYLLTELLIYLLLRLVPGRPVAAKLVAEGVAGLANFALQRAWTFRPATAPRV